MRLDIHSIIHFVGSYALTMTFFVWGVPLYWLWAVGLGILWEWLDALNYLLDWEISWLDGRGGDWVDLLVDGLGVALAVGVVSI